MHKNVQKRGIFEFSRNLLKLFNFRVKCENQKHFVKKLSKSENRKNNKLHGGGHAGENIFILCENSKKDCDFFSAKF